MKRLAKICLTLLPLIAVAPSANAYDPGFGEYDPARICYQAWCYMGDNKSVGSIVPLTIRDEDGIGLGAFIFRDRIEFMEHPFADGSYRISASVITNSDGTLIEEPVYYGPAKVREAVVTMPNDATMTAILKQGRFFIVKIYRNNKLEAAAKYPLYGISKAFSHVR